MWSRASEPVDLLISDCFSGLPRRCSRAAISLEFRGDMKPWFISLRLDVFLSGEFAWLNTPKFPPKLVVPVFAVVVEADWYMGAGGRLCRTERVLGKGVKDSDRLLDVGVKRRDAKLLIGGVWTGSSCLT